MRGEDSIRRSPDVREADLSDADLSGANLRHANLMRAHLNQDPIWRRDVGTLPFAER